MHLSAAAALGGFHTTQGGGDRGEPVTEEQLLYHHCPPCPRPEDSSHETSRKLMISEAALLVPQKDGVGQALQCVTRKMTHGCKTASVGEMLPAQGCISSSWALQPPVSRPPVRDPSLPGTLPWDWISLPVTLIFLSLFLSFCITSLHPSMY